MSRHKSKPQRGRPLTGMAMTAAERMRRMRARRKAAGFKCVASWISDAALRAPYLSHRLLEARSLAMHAVIARNIERDRTLLVAHNNLKRWRQRWSGEPPAWYVEWQEILRRPWADIAALITEPRKRLDCVSPPRSPAC